MRATQARGKRDGSHSNPPQSGGHSSPTLARVFLAQTYRAVDVIIAHDGLTDEIPGLEQGQGQFELPDASGHRGTGWGLKFLMIGRIEDRLYRVG